MLSRPIVCYSLAGLAWLAAQAVEPDLGFAAEARYAHIAAHRWAENLAALLFFVAGAGLVLAALATARIPRTGPGRRLIGAGQVLLGLAGLWLAAGRGADDVLGWFVTDPSFDRTSAYAIIDMDGGVARGALTLTLLALLLAPMLLTLGLRRAGATSWLPLVLWVAGVGFFIGIEFRNHPLEVAGIAVAAVGLALIGRAVGAPAKTAGWRSGEQVRTTARM